MSETTDAVRQLLHSRLDEIIEEAERLERALRSMGENIPSRPSTRRRSTAATKSSQRRTSRRRPKRAPRGQRQEQLLAAIKQNPGARPAELARAIGINPSQVHGLLRKARARKLIAKQGEGYKVKTG